MWSFLGIFLLGVIVISSCKKDDPEPTANPVATFQSEVSADNFLEVTFSNYSQNADSYAWDFGDGNVSTEENPVHTYAEEGTYTISLVAKNADGVASNPFSQTLTLTDPDAQGSLLAGVTSKKWYLLREGVALGIGQGINNVGWWSYGGVTPLGDRPCILDDYYEFFADGSLVHNTAGNLFVDGFGAGGWLDTEQCVDASETDLLVGENGEDLSIFANGGTFAYTYDPTIQELEITGAGSYIGLANKSNTGDGYEIKDLKTYVVFNLVEGDVADSLGVAMVINDDPDGAGAWNFYLVSYHNEADLPDIPDSPDPEPTANFNFVKNGFEVTFTNSSTDATSYSWDFGDGGSSSEVNPVYTYAGEGNYLVTLTAMDDNGNSHEVSKEVVLSIASFTADVLSNTDGKVWKLAGAASYYVGDAIGSGAWWGGITEDDLEARHCILDDEFIFTDGGVYTFDSKGQVFAEGYMGGTDACVNDEDLVAPYDGLGSGNHTFEIIDNGDSFQIKVIGNGAYVGFSKAFNGGEYSGTDTELSSEITYTVFDYSETDEKETLILSVDIAPPGWWTVVIESVK